MSFFSCFNFFCCNNEKCCPQDNIGILTKLKQEADRYGFKWGYSCVYNQHTVKLKAMSQSGMSLCNSFEGEKLERLVKQSIAWMKQITALTPTLGSSPPSPSLTPMPLNSGDSGV